MDNRDVAALSDDLRRLTGRDRNGPFQRDIF